MPYSWILNIESAGRAAERGCECREMIGKRSKDRLNAGVGKGEWVDLTWRVMAGLDQASGVEERTT